MDSGDFTVSMQVAEDVRGRERTSQRTHFERFLEAIRDLPPPPCADCPLKKKCATEKLACEAFWAYAHAEEDDRGWEHDTPPTREPNRALYRALETDEHRQLIRPRKKPVDPAGLSTDTVRMIRASTYPYKQIAKHTGLTYSMVQRIKAGIVRADVV